MVYFSSFHTGTLLSTLLLSCQGSLPRIYLGVGTPLLSKLDRKVTHGFKVVCFVPFLEASEEPRGFLVYLHSILFPMLSISLFMKSYLGNVIVNQGWKEIGRNKIIVFRNDRLSKFSCRYMCKIRVLVEVFDYVSFPNT